MNANENYAADIINRYIAAVTKKLPAGQRADIEKELRGLIDDMLQERCGGNTPTPKEVDAVLIELGPPEKLARRYNEHPNYLIGPEYYDTYLMIIKIVTACVAFGMLVANIVLAVTSPGENLFYTAWSCIGTTFMAIVQAFAYITIGFALAEYFKNRNIAQKAEENWYPNMLPPVQPVQTEIKKGEAITGIVFSCLILILFNFAPQLIGIYTFTPEARFIPLFNMEYYSNVLILFNLCFLVGLAREILKLTIGRYTVGLCVSTVVLNIVSVIATLFIFSFDRLWNPDMAKELSKLGIISEYATLTAAWENFKHIFLAVIVFAFILDTGVIIARTIRLQSKQ